MAVTKSVVQDGWGVGYGNTGTQKGYSDKNQEIERTKQVIANRSAQGMDLSAQLSHYKNLTGQDFNAPKVAAAPTSGFDANAYAQQYQQKINDMYNNQRAAELARLHASRDKAVGEVNQKKAETAPMYQGMRNQADVVNSQNVKRLRELMAANGLQASGENVSANAAMNNERANSINSLNLQEQQTMNDYNRRITDLMNPDNENALISALESERSRALLEMGMKADEIGYGRQRDSVMDSRYTDETAYNRGRDSVMDSRYNQQWNYQTGRDKVEDNRWNQQWDYQKQRDSINDRQNADAIAWEKSKFASENAWRTYVYNNMSAGEKAQMEWNKQQFGEEMAWKIEESNRSDKLSRDQMEYNAGFQTP